MHRSFIPVINPQTIITRLCSSLLKIIWTSLLIYQILHTQYVCKTLLVNHYNMNIILNLNYYRSKWATANLKNYLAFCIFLVVCYVWWAPSKALCLVILSLTLLWPIVFCLINSLMLDLLMEMSTRGSTELHASQKLPQRQLEMVVNKLQACVIPKGVREEVELCWCWEAQWTDPLGSRVVLPQCRNSTKLHKMYIGLLI